MSFRLDGVEISLGRSFFFFSSSGVILNSDSLNKRISRAKASVIQEAIKAIRELEEEARTGIMTTETILENAMDMKQGIRDLDEA